MKRVKKNKKIQKKKKRRIKVKNFVILFAIVIVIVLSYIGLNRNIINIYITGNNIYNDQEIIDMSNIDNYPKVFDISKNKIKKALEKDSYIKNVRVSINYLSRSITIDIEENKPLFYYNFTEKTVLSNGDLVADKFNVPYVINQIPDTVYDKFLEGMNGIHDDILIKISEIKYDPNDVDSERFLLTMSDGNYVYITLYKFDTLNNYISIINSVAKEKGILYLDSGEYFEVFKEKENLDD